MERNTIANLKRKKMKKKGKRKETIFMFEPFVLFFISNLHQLVDYSCKFHFSPYFCSCCYYCSILTVKPFTTSSFSSGYKLQLLLRNHIAIKNWRHLKPELTLDHSIIDRKSIDWEKYILLNFRCICTIHFDITKSWRG